MEFPQVLSAVADGASCLLQTRENVLSQSFLFARGILCWDPRTGPRERSLSRESLQEGEMLQCRSGPSGALQLSAPPAGEEAFRGVLMSRFLSS